MSFWRYFSFFQSGGGSCSLCGAPNVTKATCPLNKQAKNPNPENHNATAVVKKSPAKKSPAKRTSPVSVKQASRGARAQEPARGCAPQTAAKYHAASRRSPPYPANECCGMEMTGNDGNLYVSKADKNGVCRWQRV